MAPRSALLLALCICVAATGAVAQSCGAGWEPYTSQLPVGMRDFIFVEYLLNYAANTTDFVPCEDPDIYTYSCSQVRPFPQQALLPGLPPPPLPPVHPPLPPALPPSRPCRHTTHTLTSAGGLGRCDQLLGVGERDVRHAACRRRHPGRDGKRHRPRIPQRVSRRAGSARNACQ